MFLRRRWKGDATRRVASRWGVANAAAALNTRDMTDVQDGIYMQLSIFFRY